MGYSIRNELPTGRVPALSLVARLPAGTTIRPLVGMCVGETPSQTDHVNRDRAGCAPQATHLPRGSSATAGTPGQRGQTVRRADNAVKGKTGIVSISASEPPAIAAAEPVDTGKAALVPAAVFILVEILLAAETISVILIKDIDSRNPGAALIDILLSVALLANLGIVCGIAAARAAGAVRQSRHSSAAALAHAQDPVPGAIDTYAVAADYFDVPDGAGQGYEAPAYSAVPEAVSASGEIECAADIIGVELAVPACAGAM